MWTSRLFWKVFTTFAVLIVIAGVLFGILVARGQENELRSQLIERLRVSAILLGRLAVDPFEDEPNSDATRSLQEQIKGVSEITDLRVTYIATDGRVLADSQMADVSAVHRMENHADRLEVDRALKQGEGFSQRFSKTEGEPMMYYAVRIDRAGRPVGIARASLPVSAIQKQVVHERRIVAIFTSLVTIMAIGVVCYVLARIINPMLHLTRAVEGMSAGQFRQKIDASSHDEIGMLARAFNRMNDDLVTRIEQLHERGDQLAAVLGGMIEGVIAVDRQSHVLFANESAGRLFGFRADQTEGRPLSTLIRDESLHAAVQQAMKTRGVVNAEIHRNTPGHQTWALHATPLRGQPCPGCVVVIFDLTRVRRLESLRQEFVANVSHELKTPLSAIKAYAETLLGGAIHDQEHNVQFVQRIEDQADRLHQLILDMLSLARIESGREAYDVEDVDVRQVVLDRISEYEPTAAAKSLTLEAQEPNEPVIARVNEEALQQILDNLLTNAIKYTPNGGRVTVRWIPEQHDAVLEVIDTGPGIEAEHHDRLFERFYRVDKARSRELGGTGLGLSIVKHLAQFFGGSVGVRSQIGQGSTFWVRLPRSQKS